MENTSRYYTGEFKRQIVELKKAGKRSMDIEREYGVSRTTVNIWVKQFANSGSFSAADNLTDAEKELKILRKENKHLKMENDILKQAALILGRKDV